MALSGVQVTGLWLGGPGRKQTFTAKVAGAALAYTSAAVLYIPIRMASALWSAGGVGVNRGELAWLPPARQPIGYTDSRGQFIADPAWYRFFEYVAEYRLGGKKGPAVPTIATVVNDVQATAAASSSVVTELQQQTQANAESLAVVREVAINNSLAGAGQIPQVEL